MTHSDGPLEIIRAASRRLTAAFRGPTAGIEVLRSIGAKHDAMFRSLGEITRDAMRGIREKFAAAEETGKAFAELPEPQQRKLTVTWVRCMRCRKGPLLLRVVRIPDGLPGARYDRHLVIPTSSVTYQGRDHAGKPMTARAWFFAEHDETFELGCRRHPTVTLTPQQLRGESPEPPGIRVLKS